VTLRGRAVDIRASSLRGARAASLDAAQDPAGRNDEERLTTDIVKLARHGGRYGYRKIAELLRQAGWLINDKRGERVWRR
jgi:hypothetical protein